MRNTLILLSILFVGCASNIAKGPQFSIHVMPSEDQSIVYVYKGNSNDGVTACMKVLFNEIEKGCLQGEGYVKTVLTPGVYDLVLQTNAFMGPRIIEYKFTVEPQSIYYYEFFATTGYLPEGAVASKYFNTMGVVDGYNVLVKKDEGVALSELKLLRESL